MGDKNSVVEVLLSLSDELGGAVLLLRGAAINANALRLMEAQLMISTIAGAIAAITKGIVLSSVSEVETAMEKATNSMLEEIMHHLEKEEK